MLMNQPDKRARKALNDINADAATVFVIPGTGKRLRMRYIKPYTIERLTRVWSEVEQTAPAEDAPHPASEDVDMEHEVFRGADERRHRRG